MHSAEAKCTVFAHSFRPNIKRKYRFLVQNVKTNRTEFEQRYYLLKFRKCELKIDEVKLSEVKGVKRSYRPLRWAKKLKANRPLLSIFSFARLSALTSNRAKRSDNFYNFLTSREVLYAKLKLFTY